MYKKAFKYRIYPTSKQKTFLNKVLEECCWLYNYLLNQKKELYEKEQKSISVYDQHNQLSQLKNQKTSLNCVYSQCLQNVSVRIDLAFKAFFRRCKSGEKPGFPRFRGVGWYSSFTYPQNHKLSSPFQFVGSNKIKLAKIGIVKIILHRPVVGEMKTCTVSKTSTGKWFVSFSCDVEQEKLPYNGEQIGIDVGLKTFATLSNGTTIANPRFFKTEEKRLVKVQRKLSKCGKGSTKRFKTRRILVKVHERIANKRSNFCHQESRKIINQFGILCVEDLNIKNMLVKGEFPKLNKSISDVSWGQFLSLLSYKAENAGRIIAKVNPAYTSQDCSNCGTRQVLKLSDRTYTCEKCKLVIDRDLNASKNILRIGTYSLGLPEDF